MSKSYCFGCGADIEEDAKVCPKCGRSLEEVTPPPAPEPVKIPEPAPEPAPPYKAPSPADEALASVETLINEKRELERPQFNARLFFVRKLAGLVFVINGLLGLDIFVRYLYKYVKRHRELPDILLTVVVDILFLIAVIIGNRIMKERKPVRGEVLEKQRSSKARKAAGVVLFILSVWPSIYMISALIDELTGYYTTLSDFSEIFTLTVLCLSYMGIGIRMLFPRRVIKEAPVGGEKLGYGE